MSDLLGALGCRWDPERRLVEAADAVHRLSEREAAVLGALVDAAGAAVGRAELAEVAGLEDERAVDFAIRRLRRKVERDPSEPRVLLTVHGAGYRLGVTRPGPAPVVAPSPPIALGERAVDIALGIVRGPLGETTLTTQQTAVLQALADAGGAPVSRRELARALGASPRAVDAAVVVLRKRLEADPTRPAHLHTVRNVGYRLLRERPRTNLAQPGELVHRERERRELDEALDERRCVSIVGPPGVGKSHLAEHVAWDWATRLPGGAWWVDCASAGSAAEAARLACAALGVVSTGEPVGQLLVALSRREPLLLVLDDLDQADDAARLLVALTRAPGKVLATCSRRVDLPPLVSRVIALEGLGEREGGALFARAARDAGGRGPLDEGAVHRLVRAVDGLPLAILLAARHADLPPHEEDGVPLDALEADPSLGRHASVRASIERAWSRCSPPERRALRACAAFRDPFPLDGAVAVGGVERAHLDSLVRRSLVSPLADERRRFRLLGLVRAFVLERVPVDAELRRAHAAWFAARARRFASELRTADGEHHVRSVVDSAHDFLAAAEAAETPDAMDIVWSFAMDVYFVVPGADGFARRALELTADADRAVRARAWTCVAWLAYRADDPARAREALERAAAEGADDAPVRNLRWTLEGSLDGGLRPPDWECPDHPTGRTDFWLAWSWYEALSGSVELARRHARRAYELASRRGDRLGLRNALRTLAHTDANDPERVARLCEEARGYADDAAARANTDLLSALCQLRLGRLDRARELLDEVIGAARLLGVERIEGRARLVRVRLRLGEAPPAELLDELAAVEHAWDAPWFDRGRWSFLRALVLRLAGAADEPWAANPRDEPTAWAEAWRAVEGGPLPEVERGRNGDVWRIVEVVRAQRTGAPLPRELRDQVGRDPLLRAVRRVSAVPGEP